MKLEQLMNDCKTFEAKIWKDSDNKDLLHLVRDLRLNLCPATVYKLDSDGWNHLEIISLAQIAGKVIYKLPAADCEFLDLMQEKFGYAFGADQKFNGKYLKAKVDHFYSKKNEKGEWLCSSAVLTLDAVYGEPKAKKPRTKKAA